MSPAILRYLSKRGWPLAVIALAVLIRLFAPLDPNIDWLISNNRAFLHGVALYHDIVETNPPMAVFIYLPATLIEHWTGWAAAPVFTVMVLLAGTASAIFFSRSVEACSRWTLPVTLFVVLVAPLSAFGEREHVALILMLPLFGLLIRRAAGEAPDWPAIIVVGLLAGIAPMIKPYFALGIITACLWLAVRRRDARFLFAPEAVIAAAMTLAIAAMVWLYLPAYPREVLPLLMDVYAPLRRPLTDFIFSTNVRVSVLSALMLWLAMRGATIKPTAGVLLAGAGGFFIAFLIQGRGWPYHAYPAVALLMMAAILTLFSAKTTSEKIYSWWAVGAVLLNLVTYADFPGGDYGGVRLVAPIRAEVTAPTIMSITSDLTPGHPITTDVGGSWAGTYASRWITVNAGKLLARHPDAETRARLENWLVYDRRVINHDLATRRPDIVLVGIGGYDWRKWIAADIETARLMADYWPLAADTLTPAQKRKYEPVMAYIRKDLPNRHPDQHTQ
ncbi:hypothetical protein [Asticcacaulis sp.]|uniref:hypothetical protein n=1 Tax=Asticcacaulis sp. TaxID=1872648 RepID=UPI002C7DD7AB|nr:hypothetical protein [Asticcacaulis sp.]HTM80463.1 hypothetical protein [Asticcacaulis sp.]